MILLNETAKKALKPDPILDLDEWAKSEFMLPKSAPMQGLIDFSFTPYLPPLLKLLSWSNILRQLDVIKGTQLALTTIAEILIFCNIKLTPCNILMLFGSDNMSKDYTPERIEEPLKTNKHLEGLVRSKYDKDGNSNKSIKLFQGGVLRLKGGKTPDNYRNFSAKIGILDDVDAIDPDIGATLKEAGQGGPIDLLKNRTDAQLGVYKMYISGTPISKHKSNIWNSYKKTNKLKFFVPCPKCGELFWFDFKKIKFRYDDNYEIYEKSDPYIECVSCEYRTTESDKYEISQKGIFLPTDKSKNDKYHQGAMIPSTYSLLGLTWRDLAVQFLNARIEQKKGNNKPMISFKNTKLAIADDGGRKNNKITIKTSELYKARENWEVVPEDAVILGAGVDIQGNRYELTVIGYAENGHKYFIEYVIIGGDTSIGHKERDSPYWKLKEALQKTYKNYAGVEQSILCSAIDTNYNTKIASEWVDFMLNEDDDNLLIYPIFGKGGQYHNFVQKSVNKYGYDVWRVNVDQGKELIHNQLKLKKNKILHFPKHPSFSEKYFQQMLTERPIEKVTPSGEIRVIWWKPEGSSNEGFDTANYSQAGVEIYSIDEDTGEKYIDWNHERMVNSGSELENNEIGSFSVISEGFT